MPSTELEPRDEEVGRLAMYKEQYAARRRLQGFSVVPVGLLAVALAGGTGVSLGEQAMLALVVAVVLGFFGFSLVSWRCPACSAYLGQRLNPRSCHSCGTVFRD